MSHNTNRKTKTFSEILNEKARSGGRIGYNLHQYADVNEEEEELMKSLGEEDRNMLQQSEKSKGKI